ncbi:MAG: hemerythrin domain-containing protein [Planctomycetes bacterium]|nr:hemerythrin domain-containing protein [Planctomycetota bacterium]
MAPDSDPKHAPPLRSFTIVPQPHGTRPARIEELRREHDAFRKASAALLEALEACASAPRAAERHACLRTEYDVFARLLRRHFREEEASDVFGTDERASTATRRWVETTLAAHRDFESRLDALGRLLSCEPPSPEFEPGLRALVRDLFEHELSEERLVQRLVFEEPDGLDLVS